jgi:hypothetical protein
MALSGKHLLFIAAIQIDLVVGCARTTAPTPVCPPSSPATTSAVSVSVGREGGYSVDDLRALAQRGDWAELMAHAEDVRPAQRDEAWQELTDRAVIESSKTTLARCLDEGGERRCLERLRRAVERHGRENEAFEAGKTVAAHYGSSSAMPFFVRSLEGPNGRAHCDDEALMRAMFEALDARGPGLEDAKKAQATCRSLRKH